MTINIVDNDIVGGFKEHIIQEIVAKNIWKFNYHKKWQEAGGAIISYNGRTYFGGSINVDSVNASAAKLLEYSGVDESGILKIRNTFNNDAVNHVYANFSPTQTYTLDGLLAYFQHSLYPKLIALGSVSFSLTYKDFYDTQQSEPFSEYSFKNEAIAIASTQKVTVYDDNSINIALEALFYMTNWFEDFGSVVTVVTETQELVGYSYETTTTVTLDDFSCFNSSVKIEELYNLIYKSDNSDDYYFYFSDGTPLSLTYGASIWSLVYGYVYSENILGDTFSDGGENFVIYYLDRYWIDLEMWNSHHVDYCIFTLSKLFNIGIEQKDDNLFGGWFGSCCGGFVTTIAKFIDMLVTGLGTLAYAIAEMPLVEVIKLTGLVPNKTLEERKRIWIKVVGTIILAIITWYAGGVGGAASGASSAGGASTATAGTVGTVAGVSVTYVDLIVNLIGAVGAGYTEYNNLAVEENGKKLNSAESTVPNDPVVFVYEDSMDVGDLDIADLFIDNVYDYMEYESDMI